MAGDLHFLNITGAAEVGGGTADAGWMPPEAAGPVCLLTQAGRGSLTPIGFFSQG